MIPCNISPAAETTADFIFAYSSRSLESLYELAGTDCINLVSREYAIIHTRLEQVTPLSVTRYTYSTIPKLYGLQDTTALESGGILQALEQPVLEARGRGILLGIIDTGIDYTNPLFRFSDGSTRLLALWDQTRTGALQAEPAGDFEPSPGVLQSESAGGFEPSPSIPSPEPVGGFQPFYGRVYDREALNAALASENPFDLVPSRDEEGHGTFLAGVAAGNPITRPAAFSGAAPEATLAVVKLKPAKQYLRDFYLISPEAAAYQENDIMTGVSFLLGLANQYRMPLVILLGVGTAQGSHDGTSPLGRQLQDINARGFLCVSGTGNEVGFHHHYRGNPAEDQEFDDVELRVGEQETGFCAEIWARTPETCTVGFISPSGEAIAPIPLITGNETVVPFRLDTARITVAYQTYESGSGSQLIFLRIQTPSPGIWHLRIYPGLPGSGEFDIWLPMQGFLAENTFFLRPDPDITVNDPGNASALLTVSVYDPATGGIDIHSSRGFTRTGLIKPELAAPGVNIQGPSLRTEEGLPVLTRRTGASVAAALAAGAAADIFSWAFTAGNDQNLNAATLKAMLIRGAVQRPALSYPNQVWGYGELNLYRAF